MEKDSYATTQTILDLLHTASETTQRDRTLAALVAVLCISTIVGALVLITTVLPAL